MLQVELTLKTKLATLKRSCIKYKNYPGSGVVEAMSACNVTHQQQKLFLQNAQLKIPFL